MIQCLLVNGARQVGKTFIINCFGRENYRSHVFLNLFKNPEYKEIFEGLLSPKEIYKRISRFVNVLAVAGIKKSRDFHRGIHIRWRTGPRF